TTTLVHFAEARPQWRFLYVAFNKSVQLEAARKFPGNVLCKTAHSLAWPTFGACYRDQLIGALRVNTVMDVLGLPQYESAKVLVDTLTRFLVSAEAQIQPHHVPELAAQLYGAESIADFVAVAAHLWQLMQEPHDDTIGMLHDGYLKLFQQSRPVLDFDCILLDEAQDTNPVTADLLLSQPCAKVLVGDLHQQIYRFRGAVDIMDGMVARATLYLTQSFRFGPEVAQMANHLLRMFKAERHPVHGRGEASCIGPVEGPHTVIARTNAALFKEAVDLYPDHWLGFVGGIQGYRFSLIVDTYYLYASASYRIRDPYIKSFGSFAELRQFAETVKDWELTARCKLVETYRHQIPEWVASIVAKAVADLDQADVVLTTAHKSKGLEFTQVKLTDDFIHLMKSGTELLPPEQVDPDEVNLIYVALTRTQARVEVPPALAQFHQVMSDPQSLATEPPPGVEDDRLAAPAAVSSSPADPPVRPLAHSPHLAELQSIPGVGPQIAQDLWDLGVQSMAALKDQDPDELAVRFETLRGIDIDLMRRCVFHCAVYYASHRRHVPELLKWWNWKDKAAMAGP
ncbi:MAG: UvrD-helicase domain-containing protein, partial [Candidatus Tectomicrobia bacterium]|nr:UvrD-helicase domain-containing protein [Candidatus Tectomicrobia bacterium]